MPLEHKPRHIVFRMMKMNEIFCLLRVSDQGLLCPHKRQNDGSAFYEKYSEDNNGEEKTRYLLMDALESSSNPRP
jgi:hypothetical protein